MKKYNIFLILILSFSNIFANQIYSYEELEIPERVVRSGEIIFSEDDDFYKFDVDIIGQTYSSLFSYKREKVYGFNIWDIKPPNSPFGISLFTFEIDPENNYKKDFHTTETETLDRTHPQFKDYEWNFHTYFKGEEIYSEDDIELKSIHFYTRGERPTGPGHCMYGNYGVVDIDTWYEKSSGKLLKQIFTKRNCKPYDYKYLSKEIIKLNLNKSNVTFKKNDSENDTLIIGKTCTDLGFKKGTENFEKCALQLLDKK